MRLGVFDFALFFFGLNLALYAINTTGVLPSQSQPQPYASPSNILSQVISIDISGTNLLLAGAGFAASIIFGYLTGHLLFGGLVGIIIFAFDIAVPFLRWILFGFAELLEQILAPFGTQGLVFVTIAKVLMGAVWFWFILGLLFQRDIGES